MLNSIKNLTREARGQSIADLARDEEGEWVLNRLPNVDVPSPGSSRLDTLHAAALVAFHENAGRSASLNEARAEVEARVNDVQKSPRKDDGDPYYEADHARRLKSLRAAKQALAIASQVGPGLRLVGLWNRCSTWAARNARGSVPWEGKADAAALAKLAKLHETLEAVRLAVEPKEVVRQQMIAQIDRLAAKGGPAVSFSPPGITLENLDAATKVPRSMEARLNWGRMEINAMPTIAGHRVMIPDTLPLLCRYQRDLIVRDLDDALDLAYGQWTGQVMTRENRRKRIAGLQVDIREASYAGAAAAWAANDFLALAGLGDAGAVLGLVREGV